MSKKSCGIKIVAAVALFSMGVFADALTITGTVKDSTGKALTGIIVSVGGGGGGGAGTARDTTDASGAYSLSLTANTAATVTVRAMSGTGGGGMGGFTSATGTVAAPADGTADNITVNITMGANNTTPPVTTGGDTAVVSGTVKDSSGTAIANAIVSIRFGTTGGGGPGGGNASSRDTTDAAGAYSIKARNTNSATTVSVTATLANRTGNATGAIATPADKATDMITVNVVLGSAPVPGDTVIVSGTVKDSTGKAVANAVVSIRFGGGGGGMAGSSRDTTDAAGAYSIKAANSNGSSSVTASVGNGGGGGGGGQSSSTTTIAAPKDGKIDNVTADIVIGKQTSSIQMIRANSPYSKSSQIVRGIYSVNGRTLSKTSLNHRQNFATGASIIRYQNGFQKKVLLNK